MVMEKKQPKTGKPARKRSREGTMKLLIETGLAIFSCYGYRGATTRMISEQAGVAEALIIRYFGGKEGLLLAVVREYFHPEKQPPEANYYPPGKTLGEELQNFLFWLLERDLQRKNLIQVVMGQASVDTKFKERLMSENGYCEPPVLRERLEEYQEKGVLSKEEDLSKICYYLVFRGFSIVYTVHFILGIPLEELKENLRELASTYAKGLERKGYRALPNR